MPRLRTPQQSYGPRPGVKKGRKFEPCDRFTLTYAIQEQQTQLQSNIRGGGCPAISWGCCGPLSRSARCSGNVERAPWPPSLRIRRPASKQSPHPNLLETSNMETEQALLLSAG